MVPLWSLCGPFVVPLCVAGARGAALIPGKGVGRTGGGEEEARVPHCRDSGGEGEGALGHPVVGCSHV